MKLMNKWQQIPQEIKQINNWVCYNNQKMPFNPVTGQTAKANDASTWASFDAAVQYAERHGLGIGFQFGVPDRESGIVGIDIDHCLNPEKGLFTNIAQEILENFKGHYIEWSPSGNGLHILVIGGLPEGIRHKIPALGIEIYSHSRYFTVTGNILDGAGCSIRTAQTEINWLIEKYFKPELKSQEKCPQSVPCSLPPALNITESEIINRISGSKQGALFLRLFNGDTAGHNGDDSSADLALCNILAFWTGRDPGRMDSLFRQSRLYRKKWDEPHFADGRTYGVATIQKAIADCRTVYGEGLPTSNNQGSPVKTTSIVEPQQLKYKIFSYTDLGNAERLIYAYSDNIKYCPELKLFLIWDGRRWLKDITGEIDRIAFRTVRGIKKDVQHTDNPKVMEAAIAWAKSSESRAKLQNMIELSKVQSGVPISINELDQGKYLVNCLNGTIDLKGGSLLPHDKRQYITHCLPFEYKPFQEGQAARWVQFLCEVTNNDLSLLRYLWKLTGLCLSGDVSEHVLNIFYGSKGRNGKGLFLEIIQEILGELATVLPFASFEPKNASAIPCDIASMAGKRLVVAQESNEGKRLDEALVKSLTGGDRLTGRFMRCDLFTFKPTHKIIMSTNNKPVIRETSNAIWSRLRLVPFEVSFEGREDRQLIDKLKAELPEIFSWMVAGFSVWQYEGLEAPERIKELCKEYRAGEDTIQIFIDECCFINSQVSSPAKNIYDAFVTWAERNGEKALPRKLFYSRLESRGFDKYPSMGVARFRGISLLDIRNRTG